jgi:hypothetical protein
MMVIHSTLPDPLTTMVYGVHMAPRAAQLIVDAGAAA